MTTSAESSVTPLTGWTSRRNDKRRGGGGTRPVMARTLAIACGPETRMTAMAAGGRPEARAAIVVKGAILTASNP